MHLPPAIIFLVSLGSHLQLAHDWAIVATVASMVVVPAVGG